MKYFKAIISGFLAIAIAFSLPIPVFAIDSSAIVGAMQVAPDFGSWAWSTIKNGISSFKFLSGDSEYCPGSGEQPGFDFRHDFVVRNTTVGDKTGTFYICQNCGKSAGEVLEPAYNDYVTTLPAPSYTSDGSIQWSPKLSYMYVGNGAGAIYNPLVPSGVTQGSTEEVKFVPSFDFANLSVSVRPIQNANDFYVKNIGFCFQDVYPIDGYYTLTESCCSSYSYIYRSSQSSGSLPYTADKSPSLFYAGVKYSNSFPAFRGSVSIQYLSLQGYAPVYKITPFNPPESFNTTYNTTTRPTSITGGNYGIVGDNNQMTKVEDNSTIVNETNNTYYNPATGVTVPITNWSYDYSDRSYKVDYTTSNTTGDTVTNTSTITYGDEYITIQEIDNSQGDTITNNYTIYYLIDGSGSQTPVDPPAACEHTWTETSTTPATCTLPGSKLSTCSKCQQTKKEAVPALGHDWQVKQTVTTEYDDTGQLVQQGYTIFECSRCHEQYKSEDGKIPPGGGSGTDPGEEDEGFLSWLLGKIGEFLGTVGNGILNLLKTALEKIFGGLIDLVNSLFENLSKLVDLFGSVGEAFQVLWTWLPPEVTAILVAGVSIFVFVALLKFFMK